jgi:hypothetical protein
LNHVTVNCFFFLRNSCRRFLKESEAKSVQRNHCFCSRIFFDVAIAFESVLLLLSRVESDSLLLSGPMSSRYSLISGKTQPVQSLAIVGHIRHGICRAAYKAVFENKQSSPVETTFRLPLPGGVCSTHFNVKFKGEKTRGRVSRDSSARLEFDDAAAQGDFAVRTEVDSKNEVTIEITAMAPGEQCKISVYFALALSPLTDGFLLILPTSITSFEESFRLGVSPPPLSVRFDVRDSRPIKSLVVPFTEKSVVDLQNGIVSCDAVGIGQPFHLVITFTESILAQCLVQPTADRAFLQITAAVPRKIRDHYSQFTILLEHGYEITAGKLGLVLRAIQFFILSVPEQCRFNLLTFGASSVTLFERPELLDRGNRAKALSIAKGIDQDSPPSRAHGIFKRIRANRAIDAESVVILIAGTLPQEVQLENGDVYFFMDPFARGDLRAVAREKGAIYIPTASESHLTSALLSIIKMTASAPFTDCRVTVNDQVFPLPPTRPSELVSCFLAASGTVSEVHLEVETLVVNVPVLPADLPIVDQLWAHERLLANSAEDSEFATRILTPVDDAVATVNRDEEIEGDVTHIEAQLGRHGVGWIRESGDTSVPAPASPPTPVTGRPVIGIRGRLIRPGALLRTPSSAVAKTVVVTEDRMFVGRMPGSSAPVAPPTIIQTAGTKPALFLLSLLELQEVDGSWQQEARLKISCGFEIPDDSLGLDRVEFVTAFVIVCLRLGAPASEDQWELIAEKGILYLRRKDPSRNWDEIFAEIQPRLVK